MATLVCQYCGQSVETTPFRLRSGQRYCSKDCKQMGAMTRPSKTKVEIACLTCGKPFLCPRSWARSGRRKFCSKACQSQHQTTVVGEANPLHGIPRPPKIRDKISATRTLRGCALKGADHPLWKGGRYVNNGYVHLLIDNLPDAEKAMARAMRGDRQYITEHRLVVAMAAGRSLKPSEAVHHKNGITTDNRPENLTLMDWGPHSRKHRHVERELASALAEIERLKSLLATYQANGSPTSS